MKKSIMKLLYLTVVIIISQDAYSQGSINKSHIIELSKYYSRFMFANDASKELSKQLGSQYDNNLATSVSFIKEVTKSNNKILSDKFLVLPDSTTLKVIFIIDALHQAPHLAVPREANDIVDSLLNKQISLELLTDQYYQTIFTSVGNKNKPFDMSKVNFRMSEYGLASDRQKGIFYLRCMDMCGSQIFGFMNIVNPPNTEKALQSINKFPTFDGLNYYQYTDLQFSDFQMEILNDKGLQSYKDHFINDLFETLLNHAVCLSKEKGQEEVQDFLLSSSLKDKSLWIHTELQQVLESIFKEQ